MTLEEYLNECKSKSFDLDTHNCLIFTNNCWKIVHGKPWYSGDLSIKDINDLGDVDIIRDLYTILEPCSPSYGSLVVFPTKGVTQTGGWAMGFCVGDLSVFLGDKGLTYIPTRHIKHAWSNYA